MVEIKEKAIEGLYEIIPEVHKDFRGYLAKIFNKDNLMSGTNFSYEYLQFSNKANTIRGLHIQLSPYTEAKFIQALEGDVKWIVVDLRKNSSTFGQWDFVVLSERVGNSFYVPPGFANGSVSLTDNARVLIKSNKQHMKEFGVGINWKDSELNIDWGLNERKPIILDRDDNYPSFRKFREKYGGI